MEQLMEEPPSGGQGARQGTGHGVGQSAGQGKEHGVGQGVGLVQTRQERGAG